MSVSKLLPPCSYQGGKQRVAKQIIDYILNTVMVDIDTKFFDLCCGSGTITLELINRNIRPENITMLDIGSWGTFWKLIGNGEFSYSKFLEYSNNIPSDKSKIKEHMEALSKENADIDEAYKYILLQASSFGGKQIWNKGGVWRNASFRNYWQPTETSNRKCPVNPMQPMVGEICDRIKIILEKCKGLSCIHGDIYKALDFIPNEHCVIYIDPPYKYTQKYCLLIIRKMAIPLY